MNLFGHHVWQGETGRRHRFRVTRSLSELPADPGIYVMVRRTALFWVTPIYIGKAASLSDRLEDHEKWYKALYKFRAKERHVLRVATEDDRRRIEEDLIRHYRPVMNDMLVPRTATDAPNHDQLRRRWLKRSKRLRGRWMSAAEYYRLNDPRG
jgi:hypothetical protein